MGNILDELDDDEFDWENPPDSGEWDDWNEFVKDFS